MNPLQLYGTSAAITIMVFGGMASDAPLAPQDHPQLAHPHVPRAKTIEESLRSRPVVQAIVEEHEQDEYFRVSRLRIKHVYCGPPELLGETFRDVGPGPDFMGIRRGGAFLLGMRLEIGQRGIWLLAQHQNNEWARGRGPGNGSLLSQPALADAELPIGPDYENIERLAEALEVVWRAESEGQRIELLKEFVQGDVAEVTIGAINLLAEVVPDELVQVVVNLDLMDRALQSQAAIEDAMMQLQPEQWQESPQRAQIIAAWRERLFETTDEDDFQHIIMYLDRAMQRRSIDPMMAYEIATRLIAGNAAIMQENESVAEELRPRGVAMMRHLINEPVLRDDVLEMVLTLMETTDERRVRFTAARVLEPAAHIEPIPAIQQDHHDRLKAMRDYFADRAAEQQYPRGRREARYAAVLDKAIRRFATPESE